MPMVISQCPGCGYAGRVRGKNLGRSLRCPQCRQTFRADSDVPVSRPAAAPRWGRLAPAAADGMLLFEEDAPEQLEAEKTPRTDESTGSITINLSPRAKRTIVRAVGIVALGMLLSFVMVLAAHYRQTESASVEPEETPMEGPEPAPPPPAIGFVPGPLVPAVPSAGQLIERHRRAFRAADQPTRLEAVQGLEILAPFAPEAVPILIEALESNDAALAAEAAGALGRLGPLGVSAQPALIAALRKPNVDLRRRAAEALRGMDLGKDGPRIWVGLLLEPEVAALARQALTALGADAVPELVETLKSPKAGMRFNAASLLAAIGPDAATAAEALVAALPTADAPLRDQIGQALAAIRVRGDGPIGPRLRELVKDPDEELRVAALTILGRLDGDNKELLELLVPLLKDASKNVRGAAAEAIALRGAEAKPAVPAFLELLKDRDAEMRVRAIESLGKIGPAAREAMPALLALLRHPARPHAAEVIQALGGIDESARQAATALDIIVRFGPANATALKLFGDQDADVRARSFAFLAKVDDLGGFFLMTGLRDKNKAVYAAAVDALSVAQLQRLTQNRDLNLRRDGIKALGVKARTDPEAIAPLVAALRDRTSFIRVDAEHALSTVGKLAVPALVKSLQSDDPAVRARSAWILGQIGPDAADAVAALTEAAKDPDVRVATEANQALSRIEKK